MRGVADSRVIVMRRSARCGQGRAFRRAVGRAGPASAGCCARTASRLRRASSICGSIVEGALEMLLPPRPAGRRTPASARGRGGRRRFRDRSPPSAAGARAPRRAGRRRRAPRRGASGVAALSGSSVSARENSSTASPMLSRGRGVDAEGVMQLRRLGHDHPEVAAAGDRAPAALGQAARLQRPRRAPRDTPGRAARDTPAAPCTDATGLPSTKQRGHHSPTPRRSTTEPGTTRPKFSSDRTPYSCSGRSSVTGSMPRVASASVRDEPTNVPTISCGSPRSTRSRSVAHRRRARERRGEAIRIDLDALGGRADQHQVGFGAREQHRLRKDVDERPDHRQRRRRRHLVGRQPLADVAARLRGAIAPARRTPASRARSPRRRRSAAARA